MRSFLAFSGLFVIGFAAIALFAYPAWAWLHPLLDVPFHRVASRVGMLVLLVGFVLMARRLALADRASLGYGLPRAPFLRSAAIGLVLGVATMLPVVAIMWVLDLREPRPGVDLTATGWLLLGAKGLLSGIVVALIEETFIRGAMFTGIQRESGTRAAVLLTAALYAFAHFIGRYRIPPERVDWGSGVELIGGSLAAFATPGAILDALLTFFAVGVLLGWVRARTGHIAACLGLHAGWVWVITFVRETSVRDPDRPGAFLLSTFDGVVGWLVFGWTLVIGVVLLRFYASSVASRSIAASR
jgi:uncharacterized protein